MLTLGRVRAGLLHRYRRFVRRRALSRATVEIPVPTEVDSDVRRVFALVRDRVAQEPYPPGYAVATRWQDLLRGAFGDAGQNPGALQLARIALTLFDLELTALTRSDREVIVRRRRQLNDRHPELRPLRESGLCAANTIVQVDVGTHSNKMDQALSYYDDICAGVPKPEQLRTIVEIGSGYGRFARIMRELDQRRRYILVDLPESLVFAYAFLAVSFPAAKRVFVASPEDAARVRCQQFDFLFCPVQLIEQLAWPPVDLALNTYSFAEMPQASVDYLLSCVSAAIRPRFLYSLNMAFADKGLYFDTGGSDGEANETVMNLQPEWRIGHFALHLSSDAGRYRCTAAAVLEATPDSRVAIDNAIAATTALPQDDPRRLGNAFLAALWTLSEAACEQFYSELRAFADRAGLGPDVGYDFDRIGEVRHLKRHAASYRTRRM